MKNLGNTVKEILEGTEEVNESSGTDWTLREIGLVIGNETPNSANAAKAEKILDKALKDVKKALGV